MLFTTANAPSNRLRRLVVQKPGIHLLFQCFLVNNFLALVASIFASRISFVMSFPRIIYPMCTVSLQFSANSVGTPIEKLRNSSQAIFLSPIPTNLLAVAFRKLPPCFVFFSYSYSLMFSRAECPNSKGNSAKEGGEKHEKDSFVFRNDCYVGVLGVGERAIL